MQKIALITGASRGIGRQIAYDLARSNIKIIANYNKSEEEAIKLKEKLKNENIEIDIIKADVTKRTDVIYMIEEIIKKYGKIDILINNAGISEYKTFCEETDEDWNKVINTNLYSAFITSQETLKYMIKQKQGNIINISSIWGTIGSSCEVIYSISKAGMDGMTKALAKEVGLSNIRVNSIAPGIIDTKMNEKLTKEELIEITNEIPLGKIGKKQEISKCIKWLIEDTYTTGQIISINGGWSIT